MSTIKQLIERIIQKDFSAISPLRDFLAEDSNYRMQLYRFDNAIGRYLNDIEHWKSQVHIQTNERNIPLNAVDNMRLESLARDINILELGTILNIPDGTIYENIRGRDRFRLDRINERFIDSIKQIFWRELCDLQTVVQTFYDYFKMNDDFS
jgi:hypothetical protein